MKHPLTHPSFGRRASHFQSGFTLLEMILVVSIIAVLLGVAINKMGGSVEKSRAIAVQADIQAIKTQLKFYNGLNGFYPTTEQGLKALVTQPTSEPRPKQWSQAFEQVPRDPWDKEYNYVCPGKHNTTGFDIISSGPDRQPGTADDLGNWETVAPASN